MRVQRKVLTTKTFEKHLKDITDSHRNIKLIVKWYKKSLVSILNEGIYGIRECHSCTVAGNKYLYELRVHIGRPLNLRAIFCFYSNNGLINDDIIVMCDIFIEKSRSDWDKAMDNIDHKIEEWQQETGITFYRRGDKNGRE